MEIWKLFLKFFLLHDKIWGLPSTINVSIHMYVYVDLASEFLCTYCHQDFSFIHREFGRKCFWFFGRPFTGKRILQVICFTILIDIFLYLLKRFCSKRLFFWDSQLTSAVNLIKSSPNRSNFQCWLTIYIKRTNDISKTISVKPFCLWINTKISKNWKCLFKEMSLTHCEMNDP